MLNRTRRASFALLGLLVLGLFAGQSVLADTDLGHSGKVGPNSLTDTHSRPGATCDYKFSSGLGEGKIRSITVRPPNMAMASGRTSQVIGWSFTIERRLVGEQNTPYKVVYHSPRQTTSIGGGDSGGFQAMSTQVTFPPNDGITGVHHYRVTVNMFWFAKDDQTVNGTSRHRVDFYKGTMNTGQHWVDNEWCASVSGP